MENHHNSPNKRQGQDKTLILNFIIIKVEKGTNSTISELKKQYSEDQLFHIALKHITTTKFNQLNLF